MTKEFDIREIPSWKHFGWGALNGLFLGIAIKHGIDISEEGIVSKVLEAFIPIYEQSNMSTTWITLSIIILGLIGTFSTIWEIYVTYKRGWSQRIIAGFGFLSLLFLIVGFDTLGVIFLLLGPVMVFIFPDY